MEDEPAIVAATSRTLKTLVDGTVRLSIDFEPCDRAKAFKYFSEPGSPLAVSALTVNGAQRMQRHKYGEHAKALRLSAFFRTPAVWKVVGKDAQFLQWLRQQPCAYCNKVAPSEAAHVRRVANGAGVSIKPPYSAIPLCHEHHAQQHQNGESILGGKEWFNEKRIAYVTQWAWETLKATLGYEHWHEVPPETMRQWAEENNVVEYLPHIYLDSARNIL